MDSYILQWYYHLNDWSEVDWRYGVATRIEVSERGIRIPIKLIGLIIILFNTAWLTVNHDS